MTFATSSFTPRRRFLTLVAILGFALPCRAQVIKQKITANFRGVTPEGGEGGEGVFRYHYTEKEQSGWIERAQKEGKVLPNKLPTIGHVNWVIPESEITTAGLDRAMRTYSAEAPVGLGVGKFYQYEILSPNHPRVFGWDDNEDNRAKAEKRGNYLWELYGRFYLEAQEDKTAARAFQVALWEIIHETSPIFNLKEGAFRADYPDFAVAPAFVQKAQDYLQKLEGDTSPYDENPQLAPLQLVYLKGERSPENEGSVGQSQLALRHFVPLDAGPAPGLGTSFVSLGNPGNLGQSSALGGGASSIGDPSSSPPVNSGNGGPLGAGGPGSTSNSIGNSSSSPPVNGGGGPSGAGDRPPGPPGPPPPPTPVPAPAGVVLGLAAISACAARNGVRRKFRKK